MKRFAGMLCALIAGIGIGVMATGTFAAQQPPQAQQPAGGRGTFGAPAGACGPQDQLPAELSKNVDPKSRCFEVRMYTVDKARVGTGTFNGGINELHQRFREKEVAIFQKHGAQIVGVWQNVGNPDTLVWMLAYRYHDKPYRVFVNAGTGEVQGERPYSWVKIMLAVLAGAAAALVFAAFAGR